MKFISSRPCGSVSQPSPTLSARTEILLIWMYLIGFVAVATLLLSRGSQHADAIMDAEPSINMTRGLGPVSFTHSQVAPGSVLVPSVIYTPVLAAWLGVWGTSCAAVMSFNVVIVAGVALLLRLFAARSALICSPGLRLLTLVGFTLIPPVAQIYSINRYDSLGMLGLAGACAALTCERHRLRLVLLVLCGMLAGSAGFHVIIGSAILAVLALMVAGRSATRQFVAFGVGGGVGLALLMGPIVATGSFETLALALKQNDVTATRSLAWYLLAPVRGGQQSPIIDADLLLVSACVSAVVGVALSQQKKLHLSASMFGLMAGAVIPLALALAGRYSGTYAWLASIPMFVCGMSALDHGIASRWWRLGVAALLLLAAVAGFPARATIAVTEWNELDRKPVEAFILSHLKPDDVTYSTFVGYYPVKAQGTPAIFGSAFVSMTPQQRSDITLMIIGGKENGAAMFEPTAEEAMASFGGEWLEVGKMVVPRGAWRMAILPRPKSDCTFSVSVYRCKKSAASPSSNAVER